MMHRLSRGIFSAVFVGLVGAGALGACVAPPSEAIDVDAGEAADATKGPASGELDPTLTAEAGGTDATLSLALPVAEERSLADDASRDGEETGDDDAAADPMETVGGAESADLLARILMATDAGPTPPPALGSFAVYATESLQMNGGARVTGCNVGVENTTGPFLSNGAAAAFNSGAQIQSAETLYASSVYLNSGVSLGPVATNKILGNAGATYGAVSPFPTSMPSPPVLPPATAGTTSVSLNSGAARTLASGAYGAVTVNSGATLTLTGGTYAFASLSLNSGATLVVSAATTISVTGTAGFNSGSFLGPSPSSGLTARALVVYFDCSANLAINSGAQVQALFVATKALVTINTSKFVGAVVAAQIVMNSGATVTCQDGFGSQGCPASCDDANPCTTDACSGSACTHTPVANGGACDDGNACTQSDSCQAGVCVGASPITCAPSDACHVAGVCNPSTGACTTPAAADGTSCNDGNACTQSDVCKAGACTGSNPVTCAASDACHVAGTCNSATGVCSNPAAADGTSCNDGNACTQADACKAGACTGSNPVTCAASDACHVAGTCNTTTGVCTNPAAADGTSCSDGNACTRSDSCQAGACTGSNPVTCTASDACHVAGVCSPATGTCSNPAAADGTSCSDGNACTQTDSCVRGACTGSNPVTCVALDACHVAGACDPTSGACANPAAPDGTVCSDGNACTRTDLCASGACVGTAAVTCAPTDACHVAGTCDPTSGACSNPAASDGTTCDDGNACTQRDACQTGTCTGGTPVACVAFDACHVAGTCDPTSGACSNPAANDGTTCGSASTCTDAPTCTNGTCAPGAPLASGASCSTGTCDGNGTCEPIVDAGPDGDATVDADADVDDASDASDDADADSAVASGSGSGGSSGSGGGSGSSSSGGGSGSGSGSGGSSGSGSGGSSSGGTTCTPASCDDGNPCTTDGCNADGSCSHAAATNGVTCDDGNACTQGDSCQSGACTGGTAVTCGAADACHVGTCAPAVGCVYAAAPAGSSCGVNPNACGGALTCNSDGACVEGRPASPGTACADNTNKCAPAYTCDGAGSCVEGTAPPIDTSNPCMVGTCDAQTGVTYAPSPGAACGNVTNLCQVTYVCDATGTCQAHPAPVVSPPNACTPGVCNPATGQVTYTQTPGCDPNPTVGSAFEPQASMIGQVIAGGSGNGAPVTGFTLTVFDETTTNLPARTDVSATTATDGSFRARLTSFPTSEPDRTPPHHVVVEIDAPNYLSSFRSADLHAGMAVNLGTIHLVPLDPSVTTIDATGGTVTDSQGLVTLTLPPGAVTGPTPIRITAFRSRQDLAWPLPDATLNGYSMDIEPDGLQLQVPATVRLTNWRNMPTDITIPVGLLNKTDGSWSNETFAKWDGQKFAFQVSHFSERDINAPNLGRWVLFMSKGKDPAKSDQQCGGSTFGLANGTLRQNFTLPGVTHRGESFAVGINYDSRLTFGASQTAASGALGAVPVTGNVASVGGVNVRMSCLSQPQAEQVLSTTPGSCGGPACAPGATVAVPTGMTLTTTLGSTSTTTTVDTSGNSVEFDTAISLPLPQGLDGDSIAASGMLPTTFGLQQPGTECTGSGDAFPSSSTVAGTPKPPETYNPGTSDATPLATVDLPTFVYHRHSSPYGIGWGINGIGHLYLSPNKSDAVLVSGEGDEEVFQPRVRVTNVPGFNGAALFVHALDPVTGQVLRASKVSGVLEQVDPATGASTTVLSGLGLPSEAQMMAVGYVGGVRHTLLALASELLDIDASGNQRVLMARPQFTVDSATPFLTLASGVAVVGHYAYYTTGDQENGGQNATTTVPTVLYRFDLTAATPAAEVISAATNGDGSIAPVVTVSGYSFGDIHGLAPAADGGLYVSDRRKNVVFELLPDANGVVAGDSRMTLVLGTGNNHTLNPLGEWTAQKKFELPQPGYLFIGPDGNVWVFTSYGAAVYDPMRGEARWLVFDDGIPNQEINFSLYNASVQSSYIPVGPSTLFGAAQNTAYRIDIDLFSSQADPTRTLTLGPTGATLTDTTQDITEAYDVNGRLLDRVHRAGDPIFSVGYVGASDTIASITDPVGASTTFAYANGVLQSITDPAGRATSFTIDANSDVTSYSEVDGETWTFTYANHRMLTKKSPEGDLTIYGYSPTDGSLISIQKPAGETMTMSPGYAQKQGHDASGNPTYTSTYIDTHKVQHTVTLDEFGRTLTDQFTADGTSYTIKHDRPASLPGPSGTAPGYTNRNNRFLARESRVEVNSLLLGTDVTYDTFGRPAEMVNSANPTGSSDNGTHETVTYDVNGRVNAYTPGHDMDATSITRDANGRVSKTVLAGYGTETDFTWNADGTLQTSTVHGVTTTYVYDPATLNVKSTTDTMLRTRSFTYDAAGNVLTATTGSTSPTTGDGATTWTFAHDGNNRLTSATDANGNVTTLGYVQAQCGCSEASLLTSLQTPDLVADDKSWTFAYGAEGRLASVTDPDGNAESYLYELAGELNQLTDRNHHTTTITHDSLGRILQITDALSRAHARAYPTPTAGAFPGQDILSGSASNAAASTDFTQPLKAGDYQIGTSVQEILQSQDGNHARGWADVEFYRDATFQLSYGHTTVDDWGRPFKIVDRPSAQLTSTTVAPSGSGTGHSVQYGYINATPFTAPTSLTGDHTSTYAYNNQFDLTGSVGDYGVATANTNLTRTPDAAGRPMKDVIVQNNSFGPTLTVTKTYSYYPTGLIHTTPEGTFTYDARGLVATRVVPSGTYAYTYDEAGRSKTLTFPDGHTRVQDYDAEGRLTSRCYNYPSQATPRCYTAFYDAVGNPTTLGDPEGTDTITYDALDRLKSVTRAANGAQVASETYGYNALGALNTIAGNAVDDQRPLLTGSGTAPAAVPNTYNGAAVTLNGVGEVTSLAGTALTFNSKGFINGLAGNTIARDYAERVAVDFGAQQVFTYDGANRTGTWTYAANKWVQHGAWVYDGVDHPLEHVDENGVRQYYELDLAGNVRRLMGPGGVDLGGYRYTAFGGSITDATAPSAPTGVNALPVRWKGRWLAYSAGSGAGIVELYDMRARWWWPQGGVFVSVDDFRYHNSESPLWGWPGQNPLRWRDPTGHDGWSIGDIFAGFAQWFSGQPNTPVNFANTAPMISVQTSTIGSNGLDVGLPLHSSIITSDGNGLVSNFRGEPVSGIDGPDELRAARFSHRPDSDPDWDHDASATVIVTGSLAASKLKCIASEIRRIDREKVSYAACGGPNSNTVVATALANCGISSENSFSYLPGYTPSL